MSQSKNEMKNTDTEPIRSSKQKKKEKPHQGIAYPIPKGDQIQALCVCTAT